MATCPSCGRTRFLLKTTPCEECATVGCTTCQSDVGYIPDSNRRGRRLRFCSWDHFDRWASNRVRAGDDVRAWSGQWSFQGAMLNPEAAGRVRKIADHHRRELALAHAQHLIEAERHEDAAKIYEKLSMWKEAGEIRRSARRQISTQVHLNVNDLIEQVRRGGLATIYTCPACRSPIRISSETAANSLNACEYCGSAIKSTDLVEFLSKVVGGR